MKNTSIEQYLPSIEGVDDPFCVFTPKFISGCSDLPNFAKFIQDSPWKIRQGEILNDEGETVSVDSMDKYIASHTRFDNWEAFTEKALECWDADLSPEERAKKRRTCNIKPVYIERPYQEAEGELLDISVRGLGLKASIEMPAGGWTSVTIPKKHTKQISPLPTQRIQLRGLIRWSKSHLNHYRAGVELTSRLL